MKEALISFAIVSVFFIALSTIIYFAAIKGEMAERRIERTVNQECIKGNKVAIELKKKSYNYYRAKDEDLIMEALKGNEFAIDALKIDMKEKK